MEICVNEGLGEERNFFMRISSSYFIVFGGSFSLLFSHSQSNQEAGRERFELWVRLDGNRLRALKENHRDQRESDFGADFYPLFIERIYLSFFSMCKVYLWAENEGLLNINFHSWFFSHSYSHFTKTEVEEREKSFHCHLEFFSPKTVRAILYCFWLFDIDTWQQLSERESNELSQLAALIQGTWKWTHARALAEKGWEWELKLKCWIFQEFKLYVLAELSLASNLKITEFANIKIDRFS